MLRVINQFCHGYTYVPVAVALESQGLFRFLGNGQHSFEDLSTVLAANAGPLRVALDMLEVLEWVHREGDLYSLAAKAADLSYLPAKIVELYTYSPEELVGTKQGAGVLSPWLERVTQGWDCEGPLSLMLDGVVLLPTLIGMIQSGLLESLVKGDRQTLPCVEALKNTFLFKKWATVADDGLTLGGVGKFMLGRAMIGGVTVSYRPLLRQMNEILFGDASRVLLGHGHTEGHVDRTLNVQSSGFQHERFFAEIDKVVLDRFTGASSADARPQFIADMGCGDGSLLKRINSVIVNSGKSVRLIGIDLNQAALDQTAKNMGELPCLLIPGDVAEPADCVESLKGKIGEGVNETLHVRSFLDHNRPYKLPVDEAEAVARRNFMYTSIGISHEGGLIAPESLQQNLVEHLRCWADIMGESGLLCLEVHSMSSWAKREFFDLAEGFHFDALHAFSRQYLCDPPTFLSAMAEAGLFPRGEVRQQPAGMPYTRITLGFYEPKPYSARPARAGDLLRLKEGFCFKPGGLDAQGREEAIRSNNCWSFTLLDEQKDVVAMAFCKSTELDAKEFSRSVYFNSVGATSPRWREILLSHCQAFFRLHEGAVIFPDLSEEAVF